MKTGKYNGGFAELSATLIVAPDEFTDESDIPEAGDCGEFYNNGCDYRKKPEGRVGSVLRAILNRWK